MRNWHDGFNQIESKRRVQCMVCGHDFISWMKYCQCSKCGYRFIGKDCLYRTPEDRFDERKRHDEKLNKIESTLQQAIIEIQTIREELKPLEKPVELDSKPIEETKSDLKIQA